MSSTLPVRPLEGVLKTLTSAVTPALPGRRRRPWVLVVRGDAVDIRLGWVPDADGGEVLLSCGYALAHLELGLRTLGYESTVDVPDSGAVGATVRVGGFRCPTLAELALRKAAGWRRPYDRGFDFGPGFESAKQVVAHAGALLGVVAHELPSSANEAVLGFSTTTDTRRAHIEAGYALERAWLTATALGLAGSSTTESTCLNEFQELTPGRVQAIFRFGYPAGPVSESKEPHRDHRSLQPIDRSGGGRLGIGPASCVLGC